MKVQEDSIGLKIGEQNMIMAAYAYVECYNG